MEASIAAVSQPKTNPIVLDGKRQKTVRTLINASHRKLLFLDQVVDWEKGIDFSKPPKVAESSWIYGTPYWDALTEAQRNEVLWLETGRDVSYFIWLEQTLPELYVGYVNKYHGVLSDDVREYLMVFSREEIVHTLMFRRYLEKANLRLWSHPENIPNYSLFERQLAGKHPVYGICWNLLIEWFAELNSIFQTQTDGIDPLTRQMFKEHHLEEVRHIAFAKTICENYFEAAPKKNWPKCASSSRKATASCWTNTPTCRRSPCMRPSTSRSSRATPTRSAKCAIRRTTSASMKPASATCASGA